MTTAHAGRKQIYIQGTFQGKFARRLAWCWTLYHLGMWHSIFFVDYIASWAVFPEMGRRMSFGQHYLLFARQNWILAMWAIFVGPFFVWQLIRLSHKVAGPLLRLERTLLRMADGEMVTELKFRDDDLAANLENAFNAYLRSLQAKKGPAANTADLPHARTSPFETSEVNALELLHQVADEMADGLEPLRAAAGAKGRQDDVRPLAAPI